MTYVDRAAAVPARRSFGAASGPRAAAAFEEASEERLLVAGQGTVSFAVGDADRFAIEFRTDYGIGFRWSVEADKAILEQRAVGGGWQQIAAFEAGLSTDPACPYWFSVDCHNRTMRFGRGEMRLGTMLAGWTQPEAEAGTDPYSWMSDIALFAIDVPVGGEPLVWRDPVTLEPPMRVLPHDAVTMEDIARGQVTVPGSLSPVCQLLYDNVAGARFELDTPDFPFFAAAIRQSLENPDGWCAKRLKEKADFFGPGADPKMSYLRITLGIDQGESPGVPFVMEIWPSGHYSPIHDHAGAEAVIRVLHGAVEVTLFPYLSDKTQPGDAFAVKTFVKADVTWITPRLNQVHMLRNQGEEPCITIQCYMYSDADTAHFPDFRDLMNGEVTGFAPYSDADFLWFKRQMMREWYGEGLYPQRRTRS